MPKPRTRSSKSAAGGDDSEEEDNPRPRAPKIPADVEFKPDQELTWSKKLGIAMRVIMDDRKVHLILWLQEVSHFVV